MLKRSADRAPSEMRPVSVSYNQFGYADTSVVYAVGDTKVLVAVSLMETVPSFLRGKGSGWLSAEYSMLPTATKTRSYRDSSVVRRPGRSVEIARLIGRSLRCVLDLEVIGERTIVIDCDVLQADGGTRTACITAAGFALEKACQIWLDRGIVDTSPLKERIAALSAGVVDGEILVDLDQDEDMRAQADVNFVMTESGSVVEVQGTAEGDPVSWDEIIALKDAVSHALTTLLTDN